MLEKKQHTGLGGSWLCRAYDVIFHSGFCLFSLLIRNMLDIYKMIEVYSITLNFRLITCPSECNLVLIPFSEM